MNKKRLIQSRRNRLCTFGIGIVLLSSLFFIPKFFSKKMPANLHISPTITPVKQVPKITFHGPRFGADSVPNEYGFWSFAIVEQGKLSRSGQPNAKDFAYLKKAGYKTVINLRYPHEYNEETSDLKIAGAENVGFNFVELPMQDGGVPTQLQARKFLDIVKNSREPVHIHCRGGFGRTGLMTALYRFEMNGWPMDKAIEESRLFEGGVDSQQSDWLLDWAKQKTIKL